MGLGTCLRGARVSERVAGACVGMAQHALGAAITALGKGAPGAGVAFRDPRPAAGLGRAAGGGVVFPVRGCAAYSCLTGGLRAEACREWRRKRRQDGSRTVGLQDCRTPVSQMQGPSVAKAGPQYCRSGVAGPRIAGSIVGRHMRQNRTCGVRLARRTQDWAQYPGPTLQLGCGVRQRRAAWRRQSLSGRALVNVAECPCRGKRAARAARPAPWPHGDADRHARRQPVPTAGSARG